MKSRIRQAIDYMDESPWTGRLEFSVSSRSAAEKAVTIVHDMIGEGGRPMRYQPTIVSKMGGMVHVVKLERMNPSSIDKPKRPKHWNGKPITSRRDLNGYSIKCVEDGLEFDTSSLAAKHYGVAASTIRKSIDEERTLKIGKTFVRVPIEGGE